MMQLYGIPRSRALRCMWMLEEMDHPYALVETSARPEDVRNPEVTTHPIVLDRESVALGDDEDRVLEDAQRSKAGIAARPFGRFFQFAQNHAFDTGDISTSLGGWGIDTFATRNTFGVDFAYAKALGPSPKPTTPITEAFRRA